MSELACYFLGPFRVTLAGWAVTAFESAKVRALLAYLSIEPTRSHERDALATLLWPEHSDSAARQNLRQALYQLGQTLGKSKSAKAGEEPPELFLLVTRSNVQLNSRAAISVDVSQFRLLITECDAHRHASVQSCVECAERLQKAVELYRGGLLEGFSVQASVEFDEWYMCERESLNRGMHKALSSLTAYYEGRRQDERVLLYAQRQIRLEPWREEVYRQSMHLLARMGQRSAALAQYETCRRVLSQELNIEPARETSLLYERILAEAIISCSPSHFLLTFS